MLAPLQIKPPLLNWAISGARPRSRKFDRHETRSCADQRAASARASESEGPAARRARIRELAERLGLSHRLTHRIQDLSGGERRRLGLLRVLMNNPNILLLDEPTNDFDIQTLGALEEYLQFFHGALIIVSHDRAFLDRTVEFIYSFEPGVDGIVHIKQYPGNYSTYLEKKAKRLEQEDREASVQRNHKGGIVASFNKVILIGNLTRDPAVKYTQGGSAVAEIGLAVNRSPAAEQAVTAGSCEGVGAQGRPDPSSGMRS